MQTESPTPEAPAPRRNQFLEAVNAFFSHWLVSWIIVPIALVLILHYYVFSAYHVVGSSMIPTLQDGDYLIISKVERTGSLLAREPYVPKRGQMVVFHYPKQPDLDFVKRVAALPGERVVVSDCKVTVYNREHPEGFNPDTTHQTEGTCTEGQIDETVPMASVFVLGDNRLPGGSSDSREWGYVPSNDVVGNVVLRLFPFNQIRIF